MADSRNSSNLLISIQCYFFTVAFMLGSGLLGVPVMLARSGLIPFLSVFTVTLLVQIISVYHMVDVLQKSVIIQFQNSIKSQGKQSPRKSEDTIPLTSGSTEDEQTEANMTADVEEVRRAEMHTLGEIFLPRVGVFFLDINVLLYLISFPMAQGMAGSETLSQLLNTRLLPTVVAFCWGLNFVVFVGRRLILPFISILTIFKGSVLIITTLVAFVVGSQVNRDVHTDFSYAGIPFVIGTAVIGGVQSLMPYLFSKISFNETQIRHFRMSIIMGVVTCFLLNTLWAWAVLEVVPQYNTCHPGEHNATITQCFTHFNYTLLKANDEGEISTIPFQQVIKENYPEYNWVAMMVSIFVLGSVIVAYMVFTTSAIHLVEGAVHSLWPKDKWRCLDKKENFTTDGIVGYVASLTILSIIFAVVVCKPKGFIVLLESAGTLLVNTISGIFVTWMYLSAASSKYRELDIPLPLSKVHHYLIYPVAFYFNFAIVYNIVMLALKSSGENI